ncbi:Hsp20/alpha crystallin family protein [Cloacibacillus sp.]|uniref:Hsp20/alpha crystallin family protein n=1 Tax=Cloacibacillus sp. TaxID=2049023 RepID=UPI0025BDF3D4|nr:Hsp20/alpha crystallin family protein [Cloacibacillus sp.]MCC8057996.1 Hsp20/alpha crystallin family protein [Cloacibacillus sp.]
MIMPKLFGENLFDELMDDFPFVGRMQMPALGGGIYGRREKNLMKTDVKEKDGSYILDIDLPGFRKEDIKAELNGGYLTISADRSYEREEKPEDGKFIRRECFSGSCSRTFFVGEEVKQEDIKAKFTDGILTVTLPKEEQNKLPAKNNLIAIEG